MPNRLITYAHRAELIERFNKRIDDPASYVDVPSYASASMAAEGRFDVEIPHASIIGHGALVLAMMEDSGVEAIPFALDPKKYARIPDDDWDYGLHKYVTYEVADELRETEPILDSSLDIHPIADGGVLALCRGRGDELTTREIETVRRLSAEVPRVTFATTRFEDEAGIKIIHGDVYARATGPKQMWLKIDQV